MPGSNFLPPALPSADVDEEGEGFLLEIRTQQLRLVHGHRSAKPPQTPGKGLLLHVMGRCFLSSYWMLGNDTDARDTAVTEGCGAHLVMHPTGAVPTEGHR